MTANRNHADHDLTVLAIRGDDDVRDVDLGMIDDTHDTFLPCDSAQCERDNSIGGLRRVRFKTPHPLAIHPVGGESALLQAYALSDPAATLVIPGTRSDWQVVFVVKALHANDYLQSAGIRRHGERLDQNLGRYA